jgi:hypothetical protein
MTEFLVVAGSPRSGTSVMGATLNSMPQVAVFAEFSLTNVLRAIDETLFAGMEDRQLAPFDPDALEQFLRPTLSDHRKALIRAIYAAVYPGKAFRILGNKAPALAAIEDIDFLIECLPDLKIIYMMRDCRSVVKSSMERHATSAGLAGAWPIEKENDAIDEWWLYSFLIGRYLAKRVSVLFVKYEDLLEYPKRESERIRIYLNAPVLNFTLTTPANSYSAGAAAFADHSSELNALIDRWRDLNIEEIMACSLAGEVECLNWKWRRLGAALCDIGTHDNFNRPEPWGCWSKPGYFALRPRFYNKEIAIASIELEFGEPRSLLEAMRLRCYIGSTVADITEIREQDAGCLVVVRPTRPCVGEGLFIKLFFDAALKLIPDRRHLGVRLRRYRLVPSATVAPSRADE